jgi:hypothetical protein
MAGRFDAETGAFGAPVPAPWRECPIGPVDTGHTLCTAGFQRQSVRIAVSDTQGRDTGTERKHP